LQGGLITDLQNNAFLVSYNSGSLNNVSGWKTGAQMIDYSGRFLGKEFMVNDQTVNDQSNPAITSLANGGFAVSYNSNDGGKDPSGQGVFVRVFNPFLDISTQDRAQGQLEDIQNAIIAKDKIRANLGATQNRLSNTIQNLQIQAENEQAAESRISDVDVSQEMTTMVANQILAQSATAMLSQANSLPKMALQLIQG